MPRGKFWKRSVSTRKAARDRAVNGIRTCFYLDDVPTDVHGSVPLAVSVTGSSDMDIEQTSDLSDQPTSCRNPWHDKWGSNDADFKWPSQVPTKIQYIFRLLGYERAPGSRCKFCVQCVGKAAALKEEEIRELEKQASLKMEGNGDSLVSRRQFENMHIQQQLEKLDKLNISAEEKDLQVKQLRMLAFVNPGKFMEDFDPERSTREMKKMNRRIFKEKNSKKKEIYNENGLLISNDADMCDCLESTCPGCHFPCPKCDSEKCGSDCRNNRRWIYEHIDIEGTGKTVPWPYS